MLWKHTVYLLWLEGPAKLSNVGFYSNSLICCICHICCVQQMQCCICHVQQMWCCICCMLAHMRYKFLRYKNTLGIFSQDWNHDQTCFFMTSVNGFFVSPFLLCSHKKEMKSGTDSLWPDVVLPGLWEVACWQGSVYRQAVLSLYWPVPIFCPPFAFSELSNFDTFYSTNLPGWHPKLIAHGESWDFQLSNSIRVGVLDLFSSCVVQLCTGLSPKKYFKCCTVQYGTCST